MPDEDLRSGLLATTADTNDSSSINPAATGLAGLSSIRLWVYDPYGLREIRIAGAALETTMGRTGIGLSAQSVIFDRLRLLQANLSLASDVSTKEELRTRIGFSLRTEYARLSSVDGGLSGHLSAGAQVGILIEIVPGVYLGSVIGNWASISARSGLGGSFEAGMGILVRMSEQVRLLSDVYRTKYSGTDLRVGIEFAPVSVFHMQAGLASNPERFSAGITFLLGPVRFHFVANRHNLLGISRVAEMQLEL